MTRYRVSSIMKLYEAAIEKSVAEGFSDAYVSLGELQAIIKIPDDHDVIMAEVVRILESDTRSFEISPNPLVVYYHHGSRKHGYTGWSGGLISTIRVYWYSVD